VIKVDREVLGGGGCALGHGAAAGRRAADVEVEFIEADGTLRREPLSGCWNVAFEPVAPVQGVCVVPRAAQPAGPVVVRHHR